MSSSNNFYQQLIPIEGLKEGTIDTVTVRFYDREYNIKLKETIKFDGSNISFELIKEEESYFWDPYRTDILSRTLRLTYHLIDTSGSIGIFRDFEYVANEPKVKRSIFVEKTINYYRIIVVFNTSENIEVSYNITSYDNVLSYNGVVIADKDDLLVVFQPLENIQNFNLDNSKLSINLGKGKSAYAILIIRRRIPIALFEKYVVLVPDKLSNNEDLMYYLWKWINSIH